jgi:hypothetical protein
LAVPHDNANSSRELAHKNSVARTTSVAAERRRRRRRRGRRRRPPPAAVVVGLSCFLMCVMFYL